MPKKVKLESFWKRIIGISVVVMLLLPFSVSHGAVIFNNLDQTGLGQGTISNSYYKAQKFTTDSNNYTLNWAKIRLRSNTSGALFAKIYNDNSNLPNTEVGSLTVPSIGSTYANYTCNPSGSITLSPNGTYWVVVGVSSGAGDYDWNYTDSNSGSGVGFSTRWAYSTNAGSTWTGLDEEPFMMQVDASISESIPTLNEWGMIILALLLLVSGYFLIRRRQNA